METAIGVAPESPFTAAIVIPPLFPRHRRQIPRRLPSIEGFFRETIRTCFVTAAHEID